MSPKIIQSEYDFNPIDRPMISVEGFVVHAISEYIHRDGLKYYKGYNKSDNTFKGVPFENYEEWIHHEKWLYLIGYSVQTFMEPNGDIIRCIENSYQSYHAGKSIWKKHEGLNKYYLGAEVVMPGRNHYGEFARKMGSESWVSDLQYKSLAYEIRESSNEFGYSLSNVISHSQCASDVVRGKGKGKKDPGVYFDWGLLKKYIDNE